MNKSFKMKKIIFILIVIFVFTQLLIAGDFIDTEYGSIKIERVWKEKLAEYINTYVLITYRNTTNRTFNHSLTIRANIYDASGNFINTNSRSFNVFEHGPITPGFEGILQIPIKDTTGKAQSVKVYIESAQ